MTATITRIATNLLVGVFLAVRVSTPSLSVSQSIRNARGPELEVSSPDLSLCPVSLILKYASLMSCTATTAANELRSVSSE